MAHRFVKLDAAPERVERAAASAPLGAMLYAWTLLRGFALRSCFVEGAVSNVDEASASGWLELVAEPGRAGWRSTPSIGPRASRV